MTTRVIALLASRHRRHARRRHLPLRGGIGAALARDGYPDGGVGRITSSQVRIASLLMKDYLAIAFNVSPKQIVGPDWIDETRFDVNATIPAGVSRDEFPVMLQELLRERFQMKAHREQREFPVYALTHRKERPDADALDAAGERPDSGHRGRRERVERRRGDRSGRRQLVHAGGSRHHRQAHHPHQLRRHADAFRRSHVIEPRVTGRYDIVAKLTREEYDARLLRSAVNAGIRLPPQVTRLLDQGPGNPVGPALEAAGLALDSRRAPLDVIVIESMLRTPTEN